MNLKYKKIAVLGGDLRQITAKDELKKYFDTVSAYGIDTYANDGIKNLSDVLKNAEVILLPIPVFRGDFLNMPFSEEKINENELISALTSEVRLIIGGMFPAQTKNKLESKGIEVFDLCENEGFNIMNSVPTAEGAIALAMGNMNITVSGCNASVLGFGRIGKTLCQALASLGANVTVVARNERDITWAEILGYHAYSYEDFSSEIHNQDVIFNTVPFTVLKENLLSLMKKESLIIDLASRPGGVDTQAASLYRIRIISALSLPGKVAPVTAGKIIVSCILKKISGGIL